MSDVLRSGTGNMEQGPSSCVGCSGVDGSDLKTNMAADQDPLKARFDSLGIAEDDGCCGKMCDSEGFGRRCGEFTDPSTIIPPTSLDDLIKQLHEVFDYDDINVDYVKRLMALYPSNPAEWKKFAKFDEHRYTRNLVDRGNGKFNLMVLCWNEAQGSSIHSHADSHCFLKVLKGGVKEELFEWPDKTETKVDDEKVMKSKNVMRFNTNECTYINDSLGLHRVENESHVEKAVTLHLYSPPFQECSCFDQRSGHVTTAKMTFWSEFGKRTPFGRNPEKVEQPVEDN